MDNDNGVTVKSAVSIGVPQDVLIHEYVWRNLNQWPDRKAIVCAETGRSYTFAELRHKCGKFTKFLTTKTKLQTGDTVCLLLRNVPEFPVALLGALQAGLKVTACNPNFNKEEVHRQAVDSDARLIVTSEQALLLATSIEGSNGEVIPVAVVDSVTGDVTMVLPMTRTELRTNQSKVQSGKISPSDTALLPFSSGTTGAPKGVELTHLNVLATLASLSAPEFQAVPKDETGQITFPAILPFSHIFGLIRGLLWPISEGNKIVTIPKFGTEVFAKVLRQHSRTVLFCVPNIVQLMATNPKITQEELMGVVAIKCGASSLREEDFRNLRSKAGCHINLTQGYGLTEVSGPIVTQLGTSRSPTSEDVSSTAIGRLLPNVEAKIVPVEGGSLRGLPANERGELLLRGPQVMKGYYRNPAASEATLVTGGWLKTGDIAYYDEDDNFFIVGRLKDLIKVSGYQVSPAELEEMILGCSDVVDVAVVGVPNAFFGEAPRAFVVLRKGSVLIEDDVVEFVEERVAKHKRLTGGVVFVEAIPKNQAGKVLRKLLK